VVHARIAVGKLRRGETIVVRTSSGTIAGSISPFGSRAGEKVGVYSIPVPPEAMTGNKVTLSFEVVTEDNSQASRPASEKEIENVDLDLVSTWNENGETK
jgi:hypothetical protein